MAVAGRAIDDHACIHQLLAGGVDVIHNIGQMPEIAPTIVVFWIPVIGEFQLRGLVLLGGFHIFRCGQEDQREATGFHLGAPCFHHAHFIDVKIERCVQIFDPDHGVKIAHVNHPSDKKYCTSLTQSDHHSHKPISVPTDPINALTALFAEANGVVFFTGAGISTESGIADFRSPGGIWSRLTPIQYQDFLDDEETRLEDWRRRFHFQAEFDAAPINEGHRAVARFMGQGASLITQNIDGLHQRACNELNVDDGRIIEIHGNGTRCACLSCQSPHTLDHARTHIEEIGSSPRCKRCGGLLKAAVISFGQPMPQDRVQQAARLAQACDLFVVLGSSLVVNPAAQLPAIARQGGAELVIINREPTPLDDMATLTLSAPIGQTMAAVAEGCGLHTAG